MSNPIHFVSLGPGDPELITLKGLRTLRQADLIYCPATLAKQGHTSRAMEILKDLDLDESRISPFSLPMSKQRSEALQVYDKLFNDAIRAYHAGLQVAIVAEGDAGFYSSIQYIYDRLTEAKIPVRRIAGVPAFIAAGALAGIHIAKQEEEVRVIPGTASSASLSAAIERKQVCVIMKLSACGEAVKECVRKYRDQARFLYFEHIGTDKEFHTSVPEEWLDKKIPYFSLLIVQPY